MNIRYEIDKNNCVLVYFEDSKVPGVLQDGDYNTGEVPFPTKEAATIWAENYLEQLESFQSNLPVVDTPAVNLHVVDPTIEA